MRIHTQRRHEISQQYVSKDESKLKVVSKEFECDKCSEQFDNLKVLQEHLQTVHTQEIFSCTECDAFYDREIFLQRHIANTHQFTCKRCLLKCLSKENLVEHLKIHADDPMPYICRHCGKGVKVSGGLIQHLRVGIKEEIKLLRVGVEENLGV